MFQFEFVAELLQFRLNGPELVPLFTLPPEMTTDRAFLYPLCSLRVTFISEFFNGGLPACSCYVFFAGSSGGENPPVPLEMVIFLPEGDRRSTSTSTQPSSCSSG